MNSEILESYSTIFKVIDKTPLFSALSKEEAKELLSYMVLKKYKKGELIFEQNGSPNNIYIIENGIVKLIHQRCEKKYELDTFTTGNCFGEVALIGIMPYVASAVAISDLSLLQLSKISLHKLSKDNLSLFNKFLFNISREICRRVYKNDNSLIETLEKNLS